MSDPALALQAAVRNTLVGSAAVTALVGTRVYDRVPPAAVFPYVVIADDQILDDGNTCGDASEAFVDIHIWARDVATHPIKGAAFAKEIGEAVRSALATEIVVSGQTTSVGNFEVARNITDPDGITAHRILTFRYLLQPVEP